MINGRKKVKTGNAWVVDRCKAAIAFFADLIYGLEEVIKRPFRRLIRVRDHGQIPVIINSYNRLTCLKDLLTWLQNASMTNIHILDNGSTYPPLLAYYKTLPASIHIHYLRHNYGYRALWLSGLYRRFYWNYYIYTDPDVLPVRECPADFIQVFLKALQDYPDVGKVGFGIKIDDLPDCYNRKEEVIEWESQFWNATKRLGPFYQSAIDTTFALYRPMVTARRAHWKLKALRSDAPYLLRHVPWYDDSAHPDEEHQYYRLSQDTNNHW